MMKYKVILAQDQPNKSDVKDQIIADLQDKDNAHLSIQLISATKLERKPIISWGGALKF